MSKYVISASDQAEMLTGTAFNCQMLHPGVNCEMNCLNRFPGMFAYMAKLYLPIHLIPFLLYKRKQVKKAPATTICKCLVQYAKSVLFLSLMVQFFRYNWCKQKNLRKYIDGYITATGGLFGGMALFLESNTRAQEIALSIVPRFCETVLNYLKSRKLMKPIPNGDVLVFSIVIAIIHYYYQHQPKALKETYFKVFQKIWGIN